MNIRKNSLFIAPKTLTGKIVWWLMILPLMLALWLVFSTKILDAPAFGEDDFDYDIPTYMLCVSGDPELICKARQRVNKFESGRMGNSKGIYVPGHIRTKFTNQAEAQGLVFKDGDGEWWRAPFSGAMCASASWAQKFCVGNNTIATVDQQEMNKRLENVAKVTFRCGGAAGLVSLKGGGAVGFGLGLAACYWLHYLDLLGF